MSHQHRELAAGRWNLLSFAEQMANVGSEVERTISWKNRGRAEISGRAFERALELIDLTVADPKNRVRLRAGKLFQITSISIIPTGPLRKAGSATLAPS
jgi:hypothetical protein